MSGSTIGKIFTVTTWGESHGAAIGAVLDGVPAGIKLCEDDFLTDMSRRRPSSDKVSTKRKESDTVKIMSGVYNGLTLGTPISLIIFNEDQHSPSYDNLEHTYRPGHADFTYDMKYGFRDHRGGGRSSGRETAARVAAGVIAKKILEPLGVTFESEPVLKEDIPAGDSVGGTVSLRIKNVPAGLGEPVFDKLDGLLSRAIMSVGAVKAIEFGDGIKASKTLGSKNNDEFINKNGKIVTKTNHSGGVLGGMSTGGDIVIKAYIKPTPSISLPQKTVNDKGEPVTLEIKGRHDISIVKRVAPVLEAMCAIVLADELLANMSSKMSNVVSFYKGEIDE